jgi:hypothetical protein
MKMLDVTALFQILKPVGVTNVIDTKKILFAALVFGATSLNAAQKFNGDFIDPELLYMECVERLNKLANEIGIPGLPSRRVLNLMAQIDDHCRNVFYRKNESKVLDQESLLKEYTLIEIYDAFLKHKHVAELDLKRDEAGKKIGKMISHELAKLLVEKYIREFTKRSSSTV